MYVTKDRRAHRAKAKVKHAVFCLCCVCFLVFIRLCLFFSRLFLWFPKGGWCFHYLKTAFSVDLFKYQLGKPASRDTSSGKQ